MRLIYLSEKYIKRTQKGKGKILKEQKKRIKELISESSTRDILDKILVRSLVHIFKENDKGAGD